jgi:CRISPR-associated protein Cmr6
MEKGKLIIQATKKGFMAKIAFTKKDGKSAQLPISVMRFTDNSLNGKECEFERDGGKLTKIVIEGKTIYPEASTQKTVQKDNRQSYKSSGNQQKSHQNHIADSMRIDQTFLPKDTQEALLDSNTTEIPNFLLKLHKVARFDDKNGFSFFKRERKGENYQIKTDYQDFNFKQLAERQMKVAKNQSLDQLISLQLKLNWRLALGLGIDSVYETGITLHHIYGIPYIPASAIKGVVRSWIITQEFGEEKAPSNEHKYPFHNAEYRAYQNKEFCELFGCPKDYNKVVFDANGEIVYKNKTKQELKTEKSNTILGQENQGNLIFFDAFPVSTPSIEPDVMNPHYQPYYSEPSNNAKTPPADYHNPIPVFFLTVKDCSFQFLVGINKELEDRKVFEINIGNKTIKQWLTDALTNHGIGAKTAVGYGYMTGNNI